MVDEILLDVPGRALRPVRRDPGRRPRRPRPSSSRRSRCRSRRSTSTTTRSRSSRTTPATCSTFERFAYLADRNAQSREVWLTLLHDGVDAGVAARRPRRRARPTASSATPSGSRSAGTAPAASSHATPRSPTSTSASSWTGSASHAAPRPTSSTPSAPRSASAAARSPACTPPTSARTRSRALMRPHRRRPGRRRRRHPRLLRHDRLAGRRRRAHRVAGGRAARPRARRDHRPAVRLVAAGGALRRAGRHVRAPRTSSSPAACRTCPPSRSPPRCWSASSTASSTPFAESPGWLARYGDQEVSQFRSAEMIAEKWDISPRGHGGVRARLARRGPAPRSPRAGSRARSSRSRSRRHFDTDECPRETSLEKMAGLEPLAPGGRITAAVASQICDASSAMLIASEQAVDDARAHPAGPHPPPLGARRRPGLDADRPDPGHPARAGEDRPDRRRHRPVRVQRGVRVRRARLDAGDSASRTTRSTSTAAASPSATRSAPPAPG